MTAGGSVYLKRLKERIRENPDSKLFLSLAEELRKHDRIEEAVSVLADGIRKNPGFIGAQVTLGRWYLSGALFAEAKREFSEVLRKAPDNAPAQRGLDEAERSLGIISAEERKPESMETGSRVDSVSELPDVLAPGLAESQVAELLSEAESCISAGKYAKALNIYNDILASLRNDSRVRQKKEELALLMKLMGRDKEQIINRLNKLSSLINDRFAAKRIQRKEIAVDRLNRLSDSIRSRFAQKIAASLPEGL